MEVWKEQLDQMLDQVADYADDWEECLEMVGIEPETKELHEYLGFLVPRLKQMQRRFNWVEYNTEERLWIIHNYNFKMYRYLTSRYPEAIVTPNVIRLADEDLSSSDRDKLLAQR